MEDDEFEYDITFPSPVSTSAEDGDPAAFMQRKEPVVILLGWLGCQEKHIAKYSQFYDQNGCITISYTAPKDVAFFNVHKLKDIACKVLDLLDDYSVADNPIFFHLFSNNGGYVYNNIVKVLTSGDTRYQKLQVCGAVVDSSPGKPRYMRAAKAYGMSYPGGTFMKYLMMFGMFFFLIYTGIRAWLLTLINPSSKAKNEHFLFDNMADDPTRWPMLFLYSTHDKVVRYQDIEEMIGRRKKLGVHVDSVCWKDSDHVSHIRTHRAEYIRACCEFLSFCLRDGRDMDEDEEDTGDEMPETEQDYLLTKAE